MKTRNREMKASVLALAVQGALAAMFALPLVAHAADAADDEAAALKRPTNSIEIGVANVSKDSTKFGEYNGLNDSGASFVGNFDIRGGNAYDGGDGTTRWGVSGDDIGTTSRSLGGSVSNQGQWSLSIGRDELQHNTTTGYQTPYQGSMGGNSFTLPDGFGTSTNTLTGLSGPQLATFQNVDINNTRKNTSFSAGYIFSPAWAIKADYNRLDQSGAKLMAFGLNGAGSVASTGEKVAILPNPTNYKTDTLNLALDWKGEKGSLTGSYYGSFFRDNYDSVSVQSFWTGVNNSVMTTAPNNDFHQLNLSGGYKLSDATKLTGGLSYGRNTQNSGFVTTPLMNAAAPVSSLDGVVITSHADLKLVNQTTKDLVLSAGLKYDERNNRTASNMYSFNAIGWIGSGTANPAIYPNTPLSNKKTQFELGGDYRLNKDQNIRVAYNREDIKRWCDNYAASTGIAAGALGYYPAGTNCVVATASTDDKLSANYRYRVSEDLKLNAGYVYSDRRTDSDQNAIAAMIGANGNVPGVVPQVKGLNGGDFIGYSPFFDASRKEQMLKAGVNWQANDRLSLGLNGKFTDDDYGSIYGVQKGNNWSLNLDATYSYGEKGSAFAFVTQQHRERDMTNVQRNATTASNPTATAVGIPAFATWTNKLNDNDITIGLGAKQGGLMGGKLELAGDLTYSLAKTVYGTQLNYATTTLGGQTCSDPAILSCGDLPDIKSTMIQFKLTGNYALDKSAKVALGYIYQNLRSSDYYYSGLQYGSTPTTVLPTNQQSGSYSVNLVSATYIYTFK